jgi:ATP dependent DNA ligase C terminal region
LPLRRGARWAFFLEIAKPLNKRFPHIVEGLGDLPDETVIDGEKLKPLTTSNCPFVNLPETHKARWGEALTAEKMKKCVWVEPTLVAQLEFLEWTDGDHLRHSKFVGFREDKVSRTL